MENRLFTACLVEAIGVRLIALARVQSARAASHHPAISHTYLACLTLPFWRQLSILHWEGGELGRVD